MRKKPLIFSLIQQRKVQYKPKSCFRKAKRAFCKSVKNSFKISCIFVSAKKGIGVPDNNKFLNP